MKDIMLDLETLGNGNDAAIVSIGAVTFNPDSDALEIGDLFGDTFERFIDLEKTPADKRGVIDPSTVLWWMGQSEEARTKLRTGTKVTLGVALGEFVPWLGQQLALSGVPKDVRIWSNGPTFDEIIIRRALARYDLPCPISFRNSRCCRTMTAMATMLGFKMDTLGTNAAQHDALADAIFQARGVILQQQYLRAQRRVAVAS